MEKNLERQKKAIQKLYEERDKLILIGLTGRTGAGCTTVANLLSKDNLSDLKAQECLNRNYTNADERKYSVVKRFMSKKHRWKRFTIIEASTIIFSFVIEKKFSTLFNLLDAINNKKDYIHDIDTLKERLVRCLLSIDEKTTIKLSKYSNRSINQNIKNMNKIIRDINFTWEEKKLDKDQKIKDIEAAIQFYTCDCKKLKDEFKSIVEEYTCKYDTYKDGKKTGQKTANLYSYLMQCIGNNLRSSGDVTISSYSTGHETIVADRINNLVKLINKYEKRNGRRRTRICIDAFRNPMEIQYFRDRYRAFYVIAVNTEDKFRRDRLGLKRSEMESLDEIEYPGENNTFYHQNIQACLEISDIYLYNPDVNNGRYQKLSMQLIKYIALMLQPGLVTPTHMERCMQLAFNAKYNSGCISRQVGAVVTGTDFSVRAVGWNDVPKGQVPCNLRCVEDFCANKDSETFSEFELSDSLFERALSNINSKIPEDNEKSFAFCFKDVYNSIKKQKNQVYTRSLHAEENAFLQIAKYGGANIIGGKLFTTASPCELCSKKAYQLGIKEIYYIDPYPGISKSHILTFGKDNNPEMILFQGAIGNAYISLYTPRMPYKDELELYTGVSVKEEAANIFCKDGEDNT